MAQLKDYFERIYVINLPDQIDRRDRLIKNLADAQLGRAEDLTWSITIRGDSCPPPQYFKSGNGAWGCLQSHLRIAQEATMDGLENFLVIEDDACFHQDSSKHLERLMRELPADWDQLYLGGQHLLPPSPVEGSPFLFRGKNINRTHAFALNKKAFVRYQQHISHAPDYIANPNFHVDHQLGVAHERQTWNTYCPCWWIAGQDEGNSNISGQATPRNWWNYFGYNNLLPFYFIEGSPTESDFPDLLTNLHPGNHLKENTLTDWGLDHCVNKPDELAKWLQMIAREALDLWKLPAIQHDSITREEVDRAWKPGLISQGKRTLEELRNYPENGLFSHPLNAPVECFGNVVRRTSAA